MSQENLSLGAGNQVRLKPACSATETSWSLEISDIATIGVILSKQRTTKALIRLLHLCCSHMAQDRFSPVAQLSIAKYSKIRQFLNPVNNSYPLQFQICVYTLGFLDSFIIQCIIISY